MVRMNVHRAQPCWCHKHALARPVHVKPLEQQTFWNGKRGGAQSHMLLLYMPVRRESTWHTALLVQPIARRLCCRAADNGALPGRLPQRAAGAPKAAAGAGAALGTSASRARRHRDHLQGNSCFKGNGAHTALKSTLEHSIPVAFRSVRVWPQVSGWGGHFCSISS